MAACALLCSAPVAAAPQASPQESGVRVVWRDRPSIRFGGIARVDFRVRLQLDARASELPADLETSDVYWARRRFGVDGGVTGWFSFQIEREIGDEYPWRDVFLTVERIPAVQILVGRFKMPLGLDENTSASNLDFVYRSRAADILSPGRDRGVMVHGHALHSVFTYEAGVFQHDGENGRPPGTTRVFGGQAFTGHVAAYPFRATDSPWQSLMIGAAFVRSEVAEGFPAIQGETVFGHEFYEPDLWVLGPRNRYGVEFRWLPGPYSLKAEYIRLSQERRQQSVEDTDFPPLLGIGWYVSGTWAITGERSAAARRNPPRPITKGGAGAIELAGRMEALEFRSTARNGLPSTSPRADAVLGNRLRVVTTGVNWYPVRFFKVQFNLMYESLADPEQGPAPAFSAFWSRIVRVQFAF